MKRLVLIVMFFPFFCEGQILHNPQDLYNTPGGLFDKDSLRTIHVQFQDANYHSILQNSFFNNPSYRIPASVTLNGTTYDSCGVRYKGNSTFCLPNDDSIPKVPYNIDMNHWISGQKIMDYKKIKLANAWTDATFVREFTASKTYRKYLPSPEVNLMKLNVQGDYLGLYVNTESINKQFLEKHFDEKNGTLFKCDPAQVFCGNSSANGTPDLVWKGTDSTDYYDDYTLKSDNGWGDMVGLIDTINNHFTHIDSVLNVDRVLWAFAVNHVLLNVDAYNMDVIHNYYLYKTKDGQFQMIPWDLSESYIGALLGLSFNNIQSRHYELDPYNIPNGTPLVDKIMNDTRWRKQYTAHLRTILKESTDTTVIRNNINRIQALAQPAAVADTFKRFDMSKFSSATSSPYIEWIIFPIFGWGYGGITEAVYERANFLSNQSEISQIPPTINNVTVTGNTITAEVFNENSVSVMATTTKQASKFKQFTMYDDGTNGDLTSNDGIYTAPIPFLGNGKDVKFYVRAENADAMQLAPERAEYEYYLFPQSPTSIKNTTHIRSKKLLKIVDILGRETDARDNEIQIYMYSDGSAEKRLKLK
jgi:hypothetical protein